MLLLLNECVPGTTTKPRDEATTNHHQPLRATTTSGAPAARGAGVVAVVVMVVVVVFAGDGGVCAVCDDGLPLLVRSSPLLLYCREMWSSVSTLDSLDMP